MVRPYLGANLRNLRKTTRTEFVQKSSQVTKFAEELQGRRALAEAGEVPDFFDFAKERWLPSAEAIHPSLASEYPDPFEDDPTTRG